MNTILRQLFVALLGGVVAASVMLVADNFAPNDTIGSPNIALAQTSTTLNEVNAIDADARKTFNYQGQVYNPNTGAPYVNAGLNFSFRIYNNSGATNQVFREDKFILTNADGFFNTNIGDAGSGFGDVYNIFNGQELYLKVFVNEQELGPVQPINFTPYAFWAAHAHKLDRYDADDFPKIIAYGVVNGEGGKDSGDDFNSSRGDVSGETVYIIDLEVQHSIFDYTTIITPACDAPVMHGVGTSGGDLLVDIWDPSGVRTKCRFEFMVLEK